MSMVSARFRKVSRKVSVSNVFVSGVFILRFFETDIYVCMSGRYGCMHVCMHVCLRVRMCVCLYVCM